jgi:hypothetical protein
VRWISLRSEVLILKRRRPESRRLRVATSKCPLESDFIRGDFECGVAGAAGQSRDFIRPDFEWGTQSLERDPGARPRPSRAPESGSFTS